MNLREVTIGRSPNCDILLDPRCQYASSMHATIYCEGEQLMYRDMSTNGTIINGRRIHKKTVPIRRGDVLNFFCSDALYKSFKFITFDFKK